NFGDLVAWRDAATSHRGPSIAVISKDTAKLGYDVDRPCAARRMLLDEVENTNQYGRMAVKRVPYEAAACSCCGGILMEMKDDHANPRRYAEYLEADTPI